MNKKEIRIDLLPEDFEDTRRLNYTIVLVRAIRRQWKRSIVHAWKDMAFVLHGQIKRGTYKIKGHFNYYDFLYVKSQYEKGTKTRYYITLIPQ